MAIKSNNIKLENELPFLLGSSYCPEQWPEARCESDFKKMKKLGFNVVRMDEFVWSYFDTSPGDHRADQTTLGSMFQKNGYSNSCYRQMAFRI